MSMLASVLRTDAFALSRRFVPDARITVAKPRMSVNVETIGVVHSSININKSRFFQFACQKAISAMPHFCSWRQDDRHWRSFRYWKCAFVQLATFVPFHDSSIYRDISRRQTSYIYESHVANDLICDDTVLGNKRINAGRLDRDVGALEDLISSICRRPTPAKTTVNQAMINDAIAAKNPL